MTVIERLPTVARNVTCLVLAAATVSIWLTLGILTVNAALTSSERAQVIVEAA
ncbi:MAG: hypothetical protein C0P74_004050 [Gammaproteobacteria bacterium]